MSTTHFVSNVEEITRTLYQNTRLQKSSPEKRTNPSTHNPVCTVDLFLCVRIYHVTVVVYIDAQGHTRGVTDQSGVSHHFPSSFLPLYSPRPHSRRHTVRYRFPLSKNNNKNNNNNNDECPCDARSSSTKGDVTRDSVIYVHTLGTAYLRAAVSHDVYLILELNLM